MLLTTLVPRSTVMNAEPYWQQFPIWIGLRRAKAAACRRYCRFCELYLQRYYDIRRDDCGLVRTHKVAYSRSRYVQSLLVLAVTKHIAFCLTRRRLIQCQRRIYSQLLRLTPAQCIQPTLLDIEGA